MVPPSQRFTSQAAYVVLVVLFLSGLSLPLGIHLLGIETASLDENRVRAAMPKLRFERAAWRNSPPSFRSVLQRHVRSEGPAHSLEQPREGSRSGGLFLTSRVDRSEGLALLHWRWEPGGLSPQPVLSPRKTWKNGG